MATLGTNESVQCREVGCIMTPVLGGREEGTAYFCLKIAYCGIETPNTIKYINKTEITDALKFCNLLQ